MNLYRNQSSNPKTNAQLNLMGRTHYVDDATLKWHKSRVLSSRAVDDGLLFAIITSDALDMNNTRRGYRYVIFDVFGNTVARPDLEHAFRTAQQAGKAMWAALEQIDAKTVTMAAADQAEKHFLTELTEIREHANALKKPSVAA